MSSIVLLVQKAASPSDNRVLKAQVSRLHSSGEGDGPPTWIPLNEVNLETPEPMIGFEASLRWYIEEYSLYEPFEDARAKRMEKAIEEYGAELQTQLGLPELAKTLASSAESVSKGEEPSSTLVELYVLEDATDDEWGGIHWESLESLAAAPKCSPLSIQVSHITNPSPRRDALQVMQSVSQDTLNILVVVSRPKEEADIPYRRVTLPVTNVTEKFPRHVVTADVVGVSAWSAVEEALEEKPVGYYSIVHFDVHGEIVEQRPYLKFGRPREYVPVDKIAKSLVKHGVRAIILNACSSAEKPRPTQESLALALLNHGMLFVIGMAYKVHEDAVFHFVGSLYKSLLDGHSTVLEAVSLGRRNMQLNSQRVGKFALTVDVQDWLNPVLYCRDPTPVRLTASSEPRLQKPSCSPASSPAEWPQGFFGRDWDIAKIESVLHRNKLARIEGFRGAGKSTLTRHLAEWWKRSNFAEAVFMVDFSFTADGFDDKSPKVYPTEIFAKIDSILAIRDGNSPDRCRFYEISPSQTLDPLQLSGNLNNNGDAMNLAQAIAHVNLDGEKTTGYCNFQDPGLLSRLKSEFASTRYVIIINALHNVTSLACGGSGTFFSWIEDMRRWLEELDLLSWKSAALFSSMLTETWLDDFGSEMVTLGRLDPLYATQYANHVADLDQYMKDALQRDSLERIMEYFDYQPLALRFVLRKLVTSGLSPATYFERLLCGGTELKLESDIPDEKQLFVDFAVALMALPTWIPGLDAVQLHCPRAFIMQQLEGEGPFDAEENPLERWNDTLETLQDFAIARTVSAGDKVDVMATGDLKLHPLFSAHMRWYSREIPAPEGAEPIDITFSFLVYYLGTQSCTWDDNGELESLTKEGLKDLERNWFNVLAALQYCVLRPYLWNYQLERTFDFIMKRVTYYATFYKPREKNFVARIERSAIDRIAVAFSGHKATALTPWWNHARLATTQQEEDCQALSDEISPAGQKDTRMCDRRNDSLMPGWLFRRVVMTYLSLRVDAWKSFNPIGWEYNMMLMGLLAWRRPQIGHVPEELRPPKEEQFYCFLEQEVNICTAEIAYQTSDHHIEGLQALDRVDLSKLTGEMRETLEVRARDIRAELMGFILDAEKYQGDSATMAIVKKAEESGVLPEGERTARAIVTRRAYEAACKSKNEADFERAKMFISQDLEMVENPTDPYPLVLHRFLFDLFVLETSWESALKQLQLIEKFVESNRERYHSILHQDGPYSFLLQLHADFEKCYENLGKSKQVELHRQEYQKLLRKRNRMMDTEKERQMQRRGLENISAAMEYVIQTSGMMAPQGYKSQTC